MTSTEPQGFRRWRRTRPFWGGVLAVLGGLELIAIPLAPAPLLVHQGMAGIASWLVGALLVLAGVLMWFQPAQRVFYGVLAVLLAIASFLTSNFGGFLVGMLLGLLGGALGAAWAPGPARRDEPDDAPAVEAAPAFPPALDEVMRGAHAAPRGGRLMAFALPAVLPLAAGAHLLAPTPTPSASPSASPSPSVSASASPSPSPSPSAKATEPECPKVPSGLSEAQARKLLADLAGSADLKSCLTAGQAKTATAGGTDVVYTDASTLRASSLTMSGLSYDGVAEVPTADGPVKALKFSMSKAVLKDVDQATRHGAAHTELKTPQLTLDGKVVMYTTRMSSKLLGIPLTFTPASPPPLTLPFMIMTDVVSEQPAVRADGAEAAGLSIQN
ncbi:DUF6114 domain-containing protein [Actinomadura macrotermitis]|uniref:Uncharacterized protein n=1 Tax=Actinomadura macrotermitis TaxID=2585200 RepID=A0A7K0C0C9_9ACTN|nr:DUF6114 domain-containing protein [Actinomadura macrotermitis]MQY06925.1 hypothetical protein [Actinomadura macrotermitis]